MLEFLQGFAYGLFLSCLPWFVTGMINPKLALPIEPPRRHLLFVRYWFIVPFIAFLLWLTSLWGGFDPSLEGWLAGLAALAVEIPLERRWRRWRRERSERNRRAKLEAEATRQRAQLEQEQREKGMLTLNPAQPPVGADQVVLTLCEYKQRLLDAQRPDLAIHTDRLYSRYTRALDAVRRKFDAREVTSDRWLGLISEVARGALDNLKSICSLAHGIADVDVEYVRRRLERERASLGDDEREAFQRRLDLVEETEERLRALTARNEAAMTALDDSIVAVARVETDRPQASVAADLAMQELRRMTQKAELYGHRKDSL